jgi:glyceraldehyde 3-phosphate dehydrogenase
MATRVGINGFGRVGRQALKAMLDYHQDDLAVVAINTNADPKTCAHLFKYDSNYGIYPGTVEATEDSIIIDGKTIRKFGQKDIAAIPWSEVGADLIIESTGKFNEAVKCQPHLTTGGKKIIVTAPSKGEDITIVMGVNDDKYDPAAHKII